MTIATIHFTPPVRPYTEIRLERIPVSGGVWSANGEFAAGVAVTMTINSGQDYNIRLIAFDAATGLVSAPSEVLHVPYQAPVPQNPDAPTGLNVTYA